jgi:predicted metal-dependent peptidase
MAHFARVLGMDDTDALQRAADLEINQICHDAGFTLPASAIFPGGKGYENCPPGKTMEDYYGILAGAKSQGQPGNEPSQDPAGCGGVLPAPDKAAADAASAKWQGQVAAAAQEASQRGDLPGSLAQWVQRVLKPRVNPWEILREYMTRIAKSEQSWAKLNRRHLPRGLYLPSRHGQALGDVVLMVDTSGSIGDEQLAMMSGFMEGVLAANPGKLTVLYHTTQVYDTKEWQPEDGPLVLENRQSGGTSHVDAFDRVAQLDIEPAVIVALTDLETRFPTDPGIPTIWVDVEGGHTPPFGQYVAIN